MSEFTTGDTTAVCAVRHAAVCAVKRTAVGCGRSISTDFRRVTLTAGWGQRRPRHTQVPLGCLMTRRCPAVASRGGSEPCRCLMHPGTLRTPF